MKTLPPYFSYQNGKLFCENVDVENTAQKQGSPLYVYSYNALKDQYEKLDQAFKGTDHLICYAVKANPNQAIMKTFFSLGAGADVVSSGEMRRALNAGCDPQKIVFSGVGKTSEEIHFAVNEGIFQFNIESEQELHNIQRIAAFLDKKVSIALRVNPDVDPKTHPYISTGLKKNKFGISHQRALDLYKVASEMSHIQIQGIGCHIGSQITELSSFVDAFERIREIILELKANGIELKTVDIGGGIGVQYKDEELIDLAAYAEKAKEILGDLNLKLMMEPGRLLTANAGILVSKVVYLKKTEENKHFTILDAAFNDLMRPMLYQAYHHMIPVEPKSDRPQVETNFVGPICETTDSFADDREIELIGPGEFVAILSAGAYGSSMASNYNSRMRPCEVLVKDKMFYVIRKPDRLEDILKRETMPEFLKD